MSRSPLCPFWLESSSPKAPAFARQIGGSPGFVDENKFSWVQIELRPKPFLALLQDVGALLLLGVRGFFLRVLALFTFASITAPGVFA